MNLTINKDFLEEYKDDAWKGFSLKEIGAIIVGGLIGAGVTALLFFYAHMSPATAVYIAVPCAVPAIACGFYRYQNYLSPPQLIREAVFTWKTGHIVYEAEEGGDEDAHISSRKEI